MASRKPRGLGRGLDSLLGEDSTVIQNLGDSTEQLAGTPMELVLSAIRPGAYQPRTAMDEQALNELADSIRSQGVMQPILVRPLQGKTSRSRQKYEIIAGERRFRAARIAGLKTIPVWIKTVEDQDAAIMALIENLQREDLNPLEEAQGVKRLLDDFDFTHEQAAQAIGRSRSATTNILRLLNLTQAVQTMLLAGDIDMGHARALLVIEPADQILLANQVIARRLNVRQTEKLVQSFLQKDTIESDQLSVNASGRHGDYTRLETALSDHLGTRVQLSMTSRNKGTLKISFHDWEHLNSLLEKQGLASVLDVEA